MFNILFLLFLCLINRSVCHNVDGILHRENLQLEKSPVKIIHTKSGDMVDCIDIHKQPAFDHPLLKNHKIQRKPSFQTIGKTSVNVSQTKPIFGFERVQCPRGTVPIRRTTKDDLVSAKSFFINNINPMSQGIPGSHVAAVTLGTTLRTTFSTLLRGIPRGSFHGVGGTNTVYNPKVENYQSSASIIWARNGLVDVTNLIAVGWHVAPQLYKDNKTHLYTVWTTDNFKSKGCFNLQCPGFIQNDKEIVLGGTLNTTTTIDPEEVLKLSFSITQDLTTNNWWLHIGDKDVGYFPASLFSNMTSADQVGWGGRTTTSSGSPSPPMGYGVLPIPKQLYDSCYFDEVTFIDDTKDKQAPEIDVVDTFSDKPQCYNAHYNGDLGGGHYSLNFGGPGGNCGD